MTGGSPILIFEDWQREHPAVTDLYLGTDLVRAPGEKFEYSNGGLHLLGRTVEQAAGTSLRDYLLPRLFAPLGIVNPQWFTDREGHTLGATGLHLKTHQLARIGRLLLQRGAWDGQQLVPAEWVDRMHAEDSWVPTGDLDPESGQYGFGNWRNTIPGSFRADGAYGQFVLVLPEQDTVVTITSHQEGTPAQEIIRAVWRDLLPAL
jgi:CubicO group peptidase (beta-lactamase class C family)